MLSRIDIIGQQGNDGLGYGADMYLDELPHDHPNRNVPLLEICANYRVVGTKEWTEVTPIFGIAKKTYNQLGLVWTNRHNWKASK